MSASIAEIHTALATALADSRVSYPWTVKDEPNLGVWIESPRFASRLRGPGCYDKVAVGVFAHPHEDGLFSARRENMQSVHFQRFRESEHTDLDGAVARACRTFVDVCELEELRQQAGVYELIESLPGGRRR